MTTVFAAFLNTKFAGTVIFIKITILFCLNLFPFRAKNDYVLLLCLVFTIEDTFLLKTSVNEC